MKTFKKWNGKHIEDWGCYMSNDGNSFYRAFKNYLKREFPNATIHGFKPNHYDTSGFVEQNGKFVYISHSIDRYRQNVNFDETDCMNGVLYRTATGPKDYTGGVNNFCSINEMSDCIRKMLDA